MTDPMLECYRSIWLAVIVAMCAVLLALVLTM